MNKNSTAAHRAGGDGGSQAVAPAGTIQCAHGHFGLHAVPCAQCRAEYTERRRRETGAWRCQACGFVGWWGGSLHCFDGQVVGYDVKEMKL